MYYTDMTKKPKDRLHDPALAVTYNASSRNLSSDFFYISVLCSHAAVLGNRATPGLRVTLFSPHSPAFKNRNIWTPRFKKLEYFKESLEKNCTMCTPSMVYNGHAITDMYSPSYRIYK